MRRRRAELTPSNKDLDKTQNTQSKRRKRAERSLEDKDQADALDAQSKRRRRPLSVSRALHVMLSSSCCVLTSVLGAACC